MTPDAWHDRDYLARLAAFARPEPLPGPEPEPHCIHLWTVEKDGQVPPCQGCGLSASVFFWSILGD